MLTLACATAWWLAPRRAATTGLDPSHVDLALPVAFVAGAFFAGTLGLVGPDAATALPVHPVQVYETLLLALFILAVTRLRPALSRPGDEALLVLGGYATIEFALEFLRGDNALVPGPLTLNQLLCTGWLVIAALLAARPLRPAAPVA